MSETTAILGATEGRARLTLVVRKGRSTAANFPGGQAVQAVVKARELPEGCPVLVPTGLCRNIHSGRESLFVIALKASERALSLRDLRFGARQSGGRNLGIVARR